MESVIKNNKVFTTIKSKTIATLLAIGASIVLPQLFHLLGSITNSNTLLGEKFLPMHLSIILVGFLAGSVAGVSAGVLSPLLSFALTKMPSQIMLPYMMIELGTYGLVAGLFSKIRIPIIIKLMIVQIFGRLIKALAIIIGISVFNSQIDNSIILTSIYVGIPGLILQWILIPLIMFFINKKMKYE